MYTIKELHDYVNKGLAAIDFTKEPAELYRPLEYMIAIGGKRLRPLTCLMAYNLFSDKIDKQERIPPLKKLTDKLADRLQRHDIYPRANL